MTACNEVKALPSQQLLLELLTYDPLTGVLTWRERPLSMFRRECDHLRWNNRYAGQPAFTGITADTSGGYHRGRINGVEYRAHRIIWKMQTGEEPDKIDHKNGVRNDNRWKNLRDVTAKGNALNQSRHSTNRSGRTGVFFEKRTGRWIASIGRKQLGRFSKIEDAIAAREQAEVVRGYTLNNRR